MDCIVSITKAWRSPLATMRRTETVMFCYVALSFVDDGGELKIFRKGAIDDTTIVE